MAKNNMKQDRAFTRTAAALERKLGVKKVFSETMGAIDETRDHVDDVVAKLLLDVIGELEALDLGSYVKKSDFEVYKDEVTASMSAIGEKSLIELTEDFVAYGEDETNTPWCVKNTAGMVELWGIVSPTSEENTIGTSTLTTVCTLPEGYRPQAELHQVCQGDEADLWLLTISTGGTVSASRYRNLNEYTTPATTAWMPFNLTFMAEKISETE